MFQTQATARSSRTRATTAPGGKVAIEARGNTGPSGMERARAPERDTTTERQTASTNRDQGPLAPSAKAEPGQRDAGTTGDHANQARASRWRTRYREPAAAPSTEDQFRDRKRTRAGGAGQQPANEAATRVRRQAAATNRRYVRRVGAAGGFAAQNRQQKSGTVEPHHENDRSRPTEATEGNQAPGRHEAGRRHQVELRPEEERRSGTTRDRMLDADTRTSHGRIRNPAGNNTQVALRATAQSGRPRMSEAADRPTEAVEPSHHRLRKGSRTSRRGRGHEPPTSRRTGASRRLRTKPGKAGRSGPRTAATRRAGAKVARSAARERTPAGTPRA